MSNNYLKAIIDLNTLNQYTTFNTFAPCDALKPYIERFWSLKWQLPEQTYYDQKIIPNPHVSLVWYMDNNPMATDQNVVIEGVIKELFNYRLIGKGEILGAKFHIGGLSSFTSEKMSHFTDKKEGTAAYMPTFRTQDLKPHPKVQDNIRQVEQQLMSLNPTLDSQAQTAAKLVAHLNLNQAITSVEALANAFHMSTRSLQRIFETYVGVNPKWVIRVFRLQEIKTSIENGAQLDWAEIALNLGYNDQSHMIIDFKSILGVSPEVFKTSLDGLLKSY